MELPIPAIYEKAGSYKDSPHFNPDPSFTRLKWDCRKVFQIEDFLVFELESLAHATGFSPHTTHPTQNTKNKILKTKPAIFCFTAFF